MLYPAATALSVWKLYGLDFRNRAAAGTWSPRCFKSLTEWQSERRGEPQPQQDTSKTGRKLIKSECNIGEYFSHCFLFLQFAIYLGPRPTRTKYKS